MSWAVGQNGDGRDIGYGVPSQCDKPGCSAMIDRGMGYACGGECGRFFCSKHLHLVEHACRHKAEPSKDTNGWIVHKLRDESWAPWRETYPWKVRLLSAIIMQGYRFSKTCTCCGQMEYWTMPHVPEKNPHDQNCPQYAEFDKWLNTPSAGPL